MIRSRQEYLEYIEADRLAMGRNNIIRCFFLVDPLWSFLKLLRKVEFYSNCSTSTIAKIYLLFLRFKLKTIQLILGFSIPPNTIGRGIHLPHYGTIVIHKNARVGSNARINIDVVIGENNGADNVPIIGNNVVIEPGAKIFGKISLADGIHIGANSVVNKSFIEPNVVIVGVPAKLLKRKCEN